VHESNITDSEMLEGQGSHVNINVGGTMFTVNPSTIMNYPDTMLGCMLSERWKNSSEGISTNDQEEEDSVILTHFMISDGENKKEEKTPLFLDRDPVLFRYILAFYRDGKIVIPCTITKIEMLAEVEYFALPLDKEDIQFDIDSIAAIKKGFRDFDCMLVDKLKTTAHDGAVEACAHELAALLIDKFRKSTASGANTATLNISEVPTSSFARVMFPKVLRDQTFLNCIQGILEQASYTVAVGRNAPLHLRLELIGQEK